MFWGLKKTKCVIFSRGGRKNSEWQSGTFAKCANRGGGVIAYGPISICIYGQIITKNCLFFKLIFFFKVSGGRHHLPSHFILSCPLIKIVSNPLFRLEKKKSNKNKQNAFCPISSAGRAAATCALGEPLTVTVKSHRVNKIQAFIICFNILWGREEGGGGGKTAHLVITGRHVLSILLIVSQ